MRLAVNVDAEFDLTLLDFDFHDRVCSVEAEIGLGSISPLLRKLDFEGCCRGMPGRFHEPQPIRPSRSSTWVLERLPIGVQASPIVF
jgi:hypothetical protein